MGGRMAGKPTWKERKEKGRVGEDIVTLGFRMQGYQIHRIGIEHTEALHASGKGMTPALKADPLFGQMRKMPDFLLTNGLDHYFLEVKFRSSNSAYKSSNFIKYIIERYLGTEYFIKDGQAGDAFRLATRTNQGLWSMYENIYILLLMPDDAKIAKLSDFVRCEGIEEEIGMKDDVKVFGFDKCYCAKDNWTEAWNTPNELSNTVKLFNDNLYKSLSSGPIESWMEKYND